MGEWFLEKDWSKVQVGDLVELRAEFGVTNE